MPGLVSEGAISIAWEEVLVHSTNKAVVACFEIALRNQSVWLLSTDDKRAGTLDLMVFLVDRRPAVSA